MRVDVVLPAAGRVHGAFAAECGADVKALISVGGLTLLNRVLEALRNSGRANNVVVVGPEEIREHRSASLADCVLPEGSSGPENIYRGLEWLRSQNSDRHADRVLILTTDLPFITPEAVSHFIESCPPEVELCGPLYRRDEFEVAYPGPPAKYVKLRDGEWTTGCAFLVNPEAVIRNRSHVERVFAARKSQLTMARLLGPMFIARFLTRSLCVRHIEERCRRILGCRGTGVTGCDPVLAFDIDTIEDYRYALSRASNNLVSCGQQESI